MTARKRLATVTFRDKLLLAWAIVLLGALGLVGAVVVLANRSIAGELSRASASLNDATSSVGAQLRALAATDMPIETLLTAAGGLLDLGLEEHPGVEGGAWVSGRGVVAYAFPTYDGSEPRTQTPDAELPRLEALASQAAAQRTLQIETIVGEVEALICVAQPLTDALPGLVIWTMKRVPVGAARLLSRIAIAAGALMLTILLAGAWLAWNLSRWNSALREIGRVLAVRPLDAMPMLPAFAPRELDDIARAVNALGTDLRAARARADTLARRLAGAERLAAVGRVSTAMAHEIRNPLAAIRLRAENAIADDSHSSPAALSRILEETERLERLVATLLDLGREIRIVPERIDVRAWLEARLDSMAEAAEAAEVGFDLRVADDVAWEFDPTQLGRAVDNLLANALHAAPTCSRIEIAASVNGNELLLRISDQGPGIPAGLAERIFEPFFSTRTDGTGLGLALVREIVEAHGGTVALCPVPRGASFEMRIPCPASW